MLILHSFKLTTHFPILAIPRFQVQDVPAASVKRILQQNNVEDISEQRRGFQQPTVSLFVWSVAMVVGAAVVVVAAVVAMVVAVAAAAATAAAGAAALVAIEVHSNEQRAVWPGVERNRKGTGGRCSSCGTVHVRK